MTKEIELKISEEFCSFICSHAQTPIPHVLEVGCGHGSAAAYMCNVSNQLSLIDIDEKAVELLKIQMSSMSHVKVRCMVSNDIDETFDMVYYFLSLHHIADISSELEQAKRLLNTKGKLYICDYMPVPNCTLHHYDIVPHEGFHPNHLKELLTQKGFRIEHLQEISSLEYCRGAQSVSFLIYVITAYLKDQ